MTMRDGLFSDPTTQTPPTEAANSPTSTAFLMCPPDHFAVSYEINAWMHLDVQPNPDRAQAEWHALVHNIELAGGTVHTLDPVPGLPDMVFTTDVGLVYGGRFIAGRFRHPERRAEIAHCAAWFARHESNVVELPLAPEHFLEGGDMTTFAGYLVAGHGFRSEQSAQALLACQLGLDFLPITLIDPCMYHLDISFRSLDDRHALIAPSAWDRASCERVARLVPEPLVLDRDEALTFCANAVVVDKTIIMPACPARVGRILERWGYEICISPVGEFLKAGGAAHCLSLALDGPAQDRTA